MQKSGSQPEGNWLLKVLSTIRYQIGSKDGAVRKRILGAMNARKHLVSAKWIFTEIEEEQR
jgi:hypothetical protein